MIAGPKQTVVLPILSGCLTGDSCRHLPANSRSSSVPQSWTDKRLDGQDCRPDVYDFERIGELGNFLASQLKAESESMIQDFADT